MKNIEMLCISKDEKNIYYDTERSHAATHFADTPGLRDLVIEVLGKRIVAGNDLWFTTALDTVIGTSDVVDVDESDDIIYAIRKNRTEQGYVPFTKSRLAQESSYVSIALEDRGAETYSVSSAWIGTWDDPPFPQQPHATAESIPYWNTHAFVWGSQEIESGTEIPTRPW
jgi:hypothetical protein